MYYFNCSESKAEEKDADEDENDEKISVASDIESREVRIDLARGEGNISSSSSSSSEEEEEEEEEDSDNEIGASKGYENDDLFEKLEKDVTYIEWASSTRLAICNLEWDSLCAKDIFVVLNSFTPDSGKIQSVSVYRSDFGVKYEELEKSGSGPASINLDELDSDDKMFEFRIVFTF